MLQKEKELTKKPKQNTTEKNEFLFVFRAAHIYK